MKSHVLKYSSTKRRKNNRIQLVFNEKAIKLNLINYDNLNCGWPTVDVCVLENKNICFRNLTV